MSTGLSCRFDLRLLKEYGLSLNTRKKYFIVYCPMMWTIQAVYDDLAEALKHYHMTVADWHRGQCGSRCPHVQSRVCGRELCGREGFLPKFIRMASLEAFA